MKTGIELIEEERNRQVTEEKWTPEHDDAHKKGEMAGAAAVYALGSCGFSNPHCIELKREDATHKVRLWPWSEYWWKPSGDARRDLAKAGALIAAEIDRLNRDEARYVEEAELQDQHYESLEPNTFSS
jgi:hypothetical protein